MGKLIKWIVGIGIAVVVILAAVSSCSNGSGQEDGGLLSGTCSHCHGNGCKWCNGTGYWALYN